LKFATHCSIDSMFGNNDASLESETLAERTLPKTYGVRVHYRSELVKQKNLDFANRYKCTNIIELFDCMLVMPIHEQQGTVGTRDKNIVH